jgi:hypothetical protein
MEITTIGLDLAKNVYQVHAINGATDGQALTTSKSKSLGR